MITRVSDLKLSSGTAFKSLQRGVATISTGTTNLAISPVDLTKAIVKISVNSGTINNSANSSITAEITTATNLQFVVGAFSANLTVSWEVVEFNNLRSLQIFTLSAQTGPSFSNAITAVNTSKTMLFFTYRTSNATGNNYFATAYFSNSTTVNFSMLTIDAQTVICYVAEFN